MADGHVGVAGSNDSPDCFVAYDEDRFANRRVAEVTVGDGPIRAADADRHGLDESQVVAVRFEGDVPKRGAATSDRHGEGRHEVGAHLDTEAGISGSTAWAVSSDVSAAAKMR